MNVIEAALDEACEECICERLSIAPINHNEFLGIMGLLESFTNDLNKVIGAYIKEVAEGFDSFEPSEISGLGSEADSKPLSTVISEYGEPAHKMGFVKAYRDLLRAMKSNKVPEEKQKAIIIALFPRDVRRKYQFSAEAPPVKMPEITGEVISDKVRIWLSEVISKVGLDKLRYLDEIQFDLSYAPTELMDYQPASRRVTIPRNAQELDAAHFKFAAAHELGHAYDMQKNRGYWADINKVDAEKFADAFASGHYSMPSDWATYRDQYTASKVGQFEQFEAARVDNLRVATSEEILKQARYIVIDDLRAAKSVQQIRDDILLLEGQSRDRAMRIARTETSKIANEAVLEKYKASGVIEKVEIVLGGDPCPDCIDAQQGGPYTLDEVLGLLPLHPNCVCTYIPITSLSE